MKGEDVNDVTFSFQDDYLLKAFDVSMHSFFIFDRFIIYFKYS